MNSSILFNISNCNRIIAEKISFASSLINNS